MLMVLTPVTPARRRLFHRRPPSVRAVWRRAGEARYVCLEALCGADGQIDWPAVCAHAGREAGRLLLPAGIEPPPGGGVNPFTGRALCCALMEQAAHALLRALRLPPVRVRIGIVDTAGIFPDLPLSFVPVAADVRVVTARPCRYEAAQREAMARYGAVLPVSGVSSGLRDCLLVLTPDPALPAALPLPRGLVLAAAAGAPRRGVVDGYVPVIPPYVRAALPPGCDIGRFAAGLYELSGLTALGAQPPTHLRLGGRVLPLRDAAWRLAGVDIGLCV